MAFDILSFAIGKAAGGGSDIELIENLPVSVDFSEGDQFIEAPEGQAVKSAIIQKPENLVAENIAKDVNIAGIIGTFAGGGGGGSLPAGVYLSSPEWIMPSTYRYRVFKYNGNTYAAGGSIVGLGYMSQLFALDAETKTWSTLLTSNSSTAGINGTKLDSTSWACAEYNGKMHFIGSGMSHAMFDGATFTVLNDLPNRTEGTGCVVYQNKLVCYVSGSMYEWDETTDSWSVMAQLASNSYTYYYLFGVNDELYAIKSTTVYRYNNGTLEEVGTIPASIGSGSIVNNGCIWFVKKSSKYLTLYKYNPMSNETTQWQMSPFDDALLSYDEDELSFVGLTNRSTTAGEVPFFKVNIIE